MHHRLGQVKLSGMTKWRILLERGKSRKNHQVSYFYLYFIAEKGEIYYYFLPIYFFRHQLQTAKTESLATDSDSIYGTAFVFHNRSGVYTYWSRSFSSIR